MLTHLFSLPIFFLEIGVIVDMITVATTIIVITVIIVNTRRGVLPTTIIVHLPLPRTVTHLTNITTHHHHLVITRHTRLSTTPTFRHTTMTTNLMTTPIRHHMMTPTHLVITPTHLVTLLHSHSHCLSSPFVERALRHLHQVYTLLL